jgi:hypothetical protein
MSVSLAEKLKELIGHEGHSILDDGPRLEALLRDYCAGEKRDVYVLITALNEEVPRRLLTVTSGIPLEPVRATLTENLHQSRGLDIQVARWAVDSWAVALGLEASSELVLERTCPFCSNSSPSLVCSFCGRDTTVPRKICRGCGKMVPMEDANCWNCGSHFRNELAWKIPVAILIGIISLLLGMIADHFK